MVCSAFFGELSEARKKEWNNKDSNPYEVLFSPISLERMAHKLLYDGDKYFSNKIQVDWGSFAWKCTPEEIYGFLFENRNDRSWTIDVDEQMVDAVKNYIVARGDVPYGVVFIELY